MKRIHLHVGSNLNHFILSHKLNMRNNCKKKTHQIMQDYIYNKLSNRTPTSAGEKSERSESDWPAISLK